MKKTDFSKSTYENVNLFVSLLWLVSFGVAFIYKVFFWRWPQNNKYLLELIKRRSKLQEKNMPCKRALDFDQWKTFSENYKSIRVWLWLVYKFADNNCRSQLFFEFIRTQNKYPTPSTK